MLRLYARRGPKFLVLMTAGRFAWYRSLRLRLFRLFPAGTKPPAPADSSAVESFDMDEAVSDLKRDGYFAGLRLRAVVQQEILEFLYNTTCFGNGDPGCPLLYSEKAGAAARYGRKLTVGRYYYIRRDCPAIERLSRDPALINIANAYAGAPCLPIGTRAWWSFAAGSTESEKKRDAQAFHYDLDGYGVLYFFFYLTDTDASTGAHVCVSGSHRRKPWRCFVSLSRTLTDSEIVRYYGEDRVTVWEGSAGSGFVEDTTCFHKGLHPANGDRLILQVRFGPQDYGFTSDEADLAYDTVNLVGRAR